MKHWLHAFRLRTLPLAVSSIIVGSALAYSEQRLSSIIVFKPMVMGLALLTAVLLQILSNLANDLGDHHHGTDNKDRIGPQRAVQSGAITPQAMKRAMIICGVLAFASGIWLIVSAMGLSLTTLVFMLIGLAAIGAAVKYTYGSNPYGYAGFGDVSVFLFFGLVGVVGTYYLHTGSFTPHILLPAIAFGLLSTGVLNTNNMRDIENDAASGKRTVVVRMGALPAKIYHSALIIGATACLCIFLPANLSSGWRVAGLMVFLLPISHLVSVWRKQNSLELDPELKRLALSTFACALFLSAMLVIDSLPE